MIAVHKSVTGKRFQNMRDVIYGRPLNLTFIEFSIRAYFNDISQFGTFFSSKKKLDPRLPGKVMRLPKNFGISQKSKVRHTYGTF